MVSLFDEDTAKVSLFEEDLIAKGSLFDEDTHVTLSNIPAVIHYACSIAYSLRLSLLKE